MVHTEPGPLMKLGVSSSVRLIGQVCPGLRLPVIEVSSEGPLCSRHCTLLRSTPTAKKLAAPCLPPPSEDGKLWSPRWHIGAVVPRTGRAQSGQVGRQAVAASPCQL
ncbi:Protein cramped-like [Dissostichus eleginoides]|uniref:Protein cramped-like n=1 Tax=Dissostichus eleginoides TaxID=100907 RepID=A0AAD9F461_DISEL|nr:Protein cramped-like [Dissostichus eleginoides]